MSEEVDAMLLYAFDKGESSLWSDSVLNELYDQAQSAFENWQESLAEERLDEGGPDYEQARESYIEAFNDGFYEGIHASERKALFDFVRKVASKDLSGLHAVEEAERLLVQWKKKDYNTDPYDVYATRGSA